MSSLIKLFESFNINPIISDIRDILFDIECIWGPFEILESKPWGNIKNDAYHKPGVITIRTGYNEHVDISKLSDNILHLYDYCKMMNHVIIDFQLVYRFGYGVHRKLMRSYIKSLDDFMDLTERLSSEGDCVVNICLDISPSGS